VDKFVIPHVHEWSESNDYSHMQPLMEELYKAKLLPGFLGLDWPTEYTDCEPPCGIKAKDWDSFHEAIASDEMARCASGGVMLGMAGYGIALPPVLRFGSPFLREKVKDVLTGKKIICLNITEPYAGSDVANIRTTAKLSSDKKFYVVNGEKKWITNGMFADFFTVAVRTGGPGMGGISLLLLEKNMPGIECRLMKVQGYIIYLLNKMLGIRNNLCYF
jgi:alkylation response protein AidB-like acyl-CoA dehydrogenase